VRPKLFSSLCYIRCKLCIYFPSRLALSPNWSKWAALEPRHLGVPLGTSKMIFEPMVHLAQTVHLSFVKISIISKRIKTSFHLNLITKEYHWVWPNQLPSLWYIWHKPSSYLESRLTLSLNGPKGASLEPCNLEVPLGTSKIISKPMIHLVQTVHLSWVKISTISKWTETSFHLSVVTLEYHRVRPKRLLSR
jgi:hypothetical protein